MNRKRQTQGADQGSSCHWHPSRFSISDIYSLPSRAPSLYQNQPGGWGCPDDEICDGSEGGEKVKGANIQARPTGRYEMGKKRGGRVSIENGRGGERRPAGACSVTPANFFFWACV